MLKEHEKFRLEDEAKKSDFFAEVNYSDAEEVKECKIVKFTFPDGKECFIKREYLHSMLFAIGNPEEQQKLIPQVIETVHKYQTVLGITATKDIHKGEKINFPVSLSLPCGALRKEVIGKIGRG